MKNLTRTYLFALAIIALVIGASQFMVQDSISTGSSDSRTINISGRQRMLSQKITKASLAMRTATSEQEFLSRKSELEKAYTLWTTSHEALQYGSVDMEMEKVNNSQSILRLFSQIEPHYLDMKRAVEGILSTSNLAEALTEDFQQHLQTILQNEGDFLKLMNDITFEYDAESTARIHALSTTEYILFAIALILLVMEGTFIFRPAINKINQYTKDLLSKEKELTEALNKEEYLNNQARSIFANVKQGVFLLDEKLMISEFYSKETEDIFDISELENTNFLKLMRPRLVKRDLEALEMFVEHLFNPDIRETVVNRLNPVAQVEIFPENSTAEDLEPRHIRISFSRIMNDGQIHRVLVTVLDETDNVIMQRKIRESEERNKAESTQLLAILRVEPVALEGFLTDSITTLETISHVYETRREDNFENLIAYTFDTIHGVKGNATLVGLELIQQKLHKVEDTIVEVKRLPRIEGKDFLKIVYQISEVIVILKNMKEMQERIASVYDHANLAQDTEVSIEEQFEKTIKDGLQRMCLDTGKNVGLELNCDFTSISKAYQDSIRDIAIQLFRNSLAHGIEDPDTRASLGKPEQANIKMRIGTSKTGEMIFRYEDDGQGLNAKRIISQALKNNLIARDEIPQLTARDITNLIFRNDFSTTGQADQYSGRGQGMGLIKSIIHKHNGTYSIGFKKGQYFRMQVLLPAEQLEPQTI